MFTICRFASCSSISVIAAVGGVGTHPVGVGSSEPVALAILTVKEIPITPNRIKAIIKRFFLMIFVIKNKK
ncbi:TPA: hypothetical protein DCZ39_07630 [Patescibacteria group bacterium]|nr:hypothetical protein [Candidatus Gracilibacteria bacterium]